MGDQAGGSASPRELREAILPPNARKFLPFLVPFSMFRVSVAPCPPSTQRGALTGHAKPPSVQPGGRGWRRSGRRGIRRKPKSRLTRTSFPPFMMSLFKFPAFRFSKPPPMTLRGNLPGYAKPPTARRCGRKYFGLVGIWHPSDFAGIRYRPPATSWPPRRCFLVSR